MAEKTSDSTYRINGLYVTPNWNGASDRVAMSCGIGATIKVLRKVGVVIAGDPGATYPRTWNMTARNTILRTAAKVYLYARVERNGVNGMFIWSANIYDVEGVVDENTHAVNNDQYYYIRVGELGTDRVILSLDYGSYGLNAEGEEVEKPRYNWDDLMYFDDVKKVIVFLYDLASVAFKSIILAGKELNRVLTSKDSENESSDNAIVTAGFLQKWLGKIQGMFLRKDKPDETTHQLTMGNAVSNDFHSKDFAAGGFDGKGAGMWQVMEDGAPVGYIESDYMTLRRAAYFRSITIAEVNHIGGEVILSQAACQIAFVVPYDTSGTPVSVGSPDGKSVAFYRCYFEKKAGDREVYNQWRVGDQARCQRWDADGSQIEGSYYWRVVVATSDDEGAEQVEGYHWVDLSNVSGQYASTSCEPKPNDNIVLLGHRGGIYDRTCAQVYSTIGANAPSRRYYEGITSFALPSPIERMEFDRDENGEGHAHWRIGNNTHYVDYSKDGLDIRTSSITIVADGSDKDVNVGEALDDNFRFVTAEETAIVDADGNFTDMLDYSVFEVSRKWGESSQLQEHIGDYLITSDGVTYEFVVDPDDPSEPYWRLSSDKYLLDALNKANDALEEIKSVNKSIVDIHDNYILLANNVVYVNELNGKLDTWSATKGFLVEANFAKMFAAAFDAEGNKLKEAIVSTSVQYDPSTGSITSNINLSADKIDFEAADIAMFSQNFRIDADNFKIDKDGNVTMNNAELNNVLVHGFIYRDEIVITPDTISNYLLDDIQESVAGVIPSDSHAVVLDIRKTGSKIILQGNFESYSKAYLAVVVPSLYPSFSVGKEQLAVVRTMVGEEMLITNNTTRTVRVFGVTKNQGGSYIVGQVMSSEIGGAAYAEVGKQITIKCSRAFAESAYYPYYSIGDEIIFWSITKVISANYHQPID